MTTHEEIARDDACYSKMTTKALRAEAARYYRVADFSKADKWTCWTAIMNAKYGTKRLQTYLDETGK